MKTGKEQPMRISYDATAKYGFCFLDRISTNCGNGTGIEEFYLS